MDKNTIFWFMGLGIVGIAGIATAYHIISSKPKFLELRPTLSTIGWQTRFVGSGHFLYEPFDVSVRTGETPNSLAIIGTFPLGINSSNLGATDAWDARKRLEWEFNIVKEPEDIETLSRVQLRPATLVENDLDDIGMGIRIDNWKLIGESFGTERQTIDMGTIPANTAPTRIKIVLVPGTQVEFWKNGVLIGYLTGTAVPPNVFINRIYHLVISNKNGVTGGVNSVFYVFNMIMRPWLS